MSNSFKQEEVQQLLVLCHRRCCICHRFCGSKIEIDHINQKSEGGSDDIDNAIPVCFECHAEIHSYNDKHPRGRKFRPEELRGHKKQWLDICDKKPEILLKASRNSDVGPLQSLIDELEFNLKITDYPGFQYQDHGCLFKDNQFQRAIQEGVISILIENLKSLILEAYVAMGSANQVLSSMWGHEINRTPWNRCVTEASKRIEIAKPKIEKAKNELIIFFSSK